MPTDLVVPARGSLEAEIFLAVNDVPLHIAFHYHIPVVISYPGYHDIPKVTFFLTHDIIFLFFVLIINIKVLY